MSYIGNQPLYAAFVTDQFSGNGSTTVFTMSVAPANTGSVLVAVSGVLQDPTTYSVSGTTLTFSAAPPTGTGNISVRYLGIPASGVTTTAYRTVTEFTATAGQTTFTPPSYTVGFIAVYRNGVRLGAADYTASNGTTVVLANAAVAGDLITTESFYVSSVLNAIPATPGAVVDSYITGVSASKLSGQVPASNAPSGSVLQVVSGAYSTVASNNTTSWADTGLTATITPKFSTSKILVIVDLTGCYVAGTTIGLLTRLLRNSTPIIIIDSVAGYTSGTQSGVGSVSTNCLDSPATTASTTYKVQTASGGAGAPAYINASTNGVQGTSTITLMEIAA